MPDRSPTIENPWQHLRQLTPARIALGRAGVSLPTDAQLDFQFAHAQARDAVHLPLDCAALAAELDKHNLDHLQLHSAASDRQTYLQRPDLGRRLDEASAATLDDQAGDGCDLALVIADGLSALAVQRHAAPMALKIAEQCQAEGWALGPISLVEQG
ncbi:ethanolamine ammonia-lyase light chain EutC, partial [Stutzerimonas balearica]|uniref:ethanolamine ammonia-lyase light chain EutC n=1 Tax=Stutzerimonas balearica TaxID=74829 RepID=UPI0028A09957